MAESQIPESEGLRWRQIALIWAKIASVPLTRPEGAIRLLMELVSEVLGAEIVWVVLSVRTDDPLAIRRFGVAGAWVPRVWLALDESIAKPEVETEFMHERLKNDTWVAGRLENTGTHRTYIREDILGDAPWSSCETGWQLAQYDIRDQMVTVHAMTETLELHLGVDRLEGPDWSPAEKAWLHDLNLGLTPFCARLAMSYGLLVAKSQLTPRERETFLHLLEGESETLIAETMDLAPGTVHQYVVSIFRKFGVKSRSELMARWLHVSQTELTVEDSLFQELASTLRQSG